MAHVTISLSVEAYELLKRNKKENESFSEEIIRLAPKPKLRDIFGILTEKEADEWKKGVEEVRKKFKVTI